MLYARIVLLYKYGGFRQGPRQALLLCISLSYLGTFEMPSSTLELLERHRRVLKGVKSNNMEECEQRFTTERRKQLLQLDKQLVSLMPLLSPSPGRAIQLMPSDERRRAGVSLGWHPKQRPELITIRLDLDMDGYKLRDTFTWNLYEEGTGGITCEEFAELTCRDFDLPASVFIPAIVKSMREQLQEYREAQAMLRNAGGLVALCGVRVLIRLDITIGLLQLTDRIEWDLGEERNSPAAFAIEYVRELALPAEFVTAIANDIMEQVAHLRRALLLVGFSRDPATGAVRTHDPDLQSLLLLPVKSGQTRRDPNRLDEFTPLIMELDALEVEKIEQNRDREARRKRRHTSRGRRGVQAGTSTAVGFDGIAGPSSMANWTNFEIAKTMPTPLSYRGSLHRVLGRIDEDDDASESNVSTRATRARKLRRN